MNGKTSAAEATTTSRTRVERRSDREVVVTRTFNGPVRIVYAAWTEPKLLQRWWAPKSIGVPLISCEVDVRVGGSYRFAFGHDAANAIVFFGKYTEVIPNARLAWTNEESETAGVTTVTFTETAGRTVLVVHEVYPSKQAADEASGGMMPEQFEQLDALLIALGETA